MKRVKKIQVSVYRSFMNTKLNNTRIFWIFASLLFLSFLVDTAVAGDYLFSFGALADPQYADKSPGSGRYYRDVPAKLQDAVNVFNAEDVDFVVQLGDFVDEDDFVTRTNLNVMLGIYNQLNIPGHHVLGNHDFFDPSGDGPGPDPNASQVVTDFGLEGRYYYFTYHGWRFVVLDTDSLTARHLYPPADFYYDWTVAGKQAEADAMWYSIDGQIHQKVWNGGVSSEQLTWLDTVLADANDVDEKVIILAHRMFHPRNEQTEWNDTEVLDVIESYPCVVAVLNGHEHMSRHDQRPSGVHYLGLEAMLDGAYPITSYAVIDVYTDRLEVNGYGTEPDRSLNYSPAFVAGEAGLVSHWQMDESSGSPLAVDSIGDHNGSVYNGPVWQETSGVFGGALQLDGSDDYVEVSGFDGVTGRNSRTVSLWIKTSSGGDVIYWGKSGFNGQKWLIEIDVSSGALQVSVEGGQIAGSSDLRDNKWHQIAVVLENDGSPSVDEIKLYVDGQSEIISSAGVQAIVTASDHDIRIGASRSGYFAGLIDDVRLYNKALSGGEINQLSRARLVDEATNPDPANRKFGVDPNGVLSWLGGQMAACHDVYFGTDFNDVNDANASSTAYQERIDTNSWDPCGPGVGLGYASIYYWRIDEVDDSNVVHSGDVWQFTTMLAPASEVAVYHVDANDIAALDENPGTALLPLKTISEAVERAVVRKSLNMSSRVLIYPGVYREPSDIYMVNGGAMTDASLIIEASEAGTVIVDGSQVFDSWGLKAGESNIYESSWPYDWGMFADPDSQGWPDITRRREIVFVDGQQLTQVLSFGVLVDGTYFVDEGINKIYICSSVDITGSTVEVGVRGWLMRLDGFRNLTVRGLILQKSAGGYVYRPDANGYLNQEGLSVNFGENGLVEDCTVRWNNWVGVGFEDNNGLVVRRVSVTQNGYKSDASGNTNLLVEDSEFSYNNWRGGLGAYYSKDVAGMKLWGSNGVTFNGCDFVGNQSCGLWFASDHNGSDVNNVTVFDCSFEDNYLQGIIFESSFGPIDVNNCQFVCNGSAGVEIDKSQNGTLENCMFKSNRGEGTKGQIRVGGSLEINSLKAKNWTWIGNMLISSDPNISLMDLDNTQWGSDSNFVDTLVSSGNTGYHPNSTKAFKIGGGFKDLSQWQSETLQDGDFVFTEKLFCGCGDGYMDSDLSHDCYVNTDDVRLMFLNWTECKDPCVPWDTQIELVQGGTFNDMHVSWLDSTMFYVDDGAWGGLYYSQLNQHSSHTSIYQSLGTVKDGAVYDFSADLTYRSYQQFGYVPGDVTIYAAIAIADVSVDPAQEGVNLEDYTVLEFLRSVPVPTSDTSGSSGGSGLWAPEMNYNDNYAATAGDVGKNLYVVIGGFVSADQTNYGLQTGIDNISIVENITVIPKQHYFVNDLDKDLCVDLVDFALWMIEWLNCNNFDDAFCLP